MSNFANIRAKINAWIKYNNRKEITAAQLNEILQQMVDDVVGFQYKGMATSNGTPTVGDSNDFYLAVNTLNSAVTYTNYGGLVVSAKAMAFLKYNGAWTKDEVILPTGITIEEVLAVTDTKYLSKLNADTAAGRITFSKGLVALDDGNIKSINGQSLSLSREAASVGANVNYDKINLSNVGWGINADGQACFKSLTIRDFLAVPELRYNRITVQAGITWLAPGAGKIKKTWEYNNIRYIELDLEDGEYGAFQANDLVIGIYHTGTAKDANATLDNIIPSDPSVTSSISVKGFMTSYFTIAKVYVSGETIYDESGQAVTLTSSDARYLRITMRENYTTMIPQSNMSIVAIGNSSVSARQNSVYATTNYFRFLKGVSSWSMHNSLAMECTNAGEIIAHNSGSIKITSDNANNGYWQITGGAITHIKNGTSGLRLSADGTLYDPDGLHLKVGNNFISELYNGQFLIWQLSENAHTSSGNVITWMDYNAYSNLPSYSWTASERLDHVGDFLIYLDGITYKFVNDTTSHSGYGWQIETDKYLIDSINEINSVKSGLLDTGIDILNKEVKITSDVFWVQNNSGKMTMYLNDVGDLNIKGILNKNAIEITKYNAKKFLIPVKDADALCDDWYSFSDYESQENTGTRDYAESADTTTFNPYYSGKAGNPLSTIGSINVHSHSVDVLRIDGTVLLDSTLYGTSSSPYDWFTTGSSQSVQNLLLLPFMRFMGVTGSEYNFDSLRTPTRNDTGSLHLITVDELRSLVGKRFTICNNTGAAIWVLTCGHTKDNLNQIVVTRNYQTASTISDNITYYDSEPFYACIENGKSATIEYKQAVWGNGGQTYITKDSVDIIPSIVAISGASQQFSKTTINASDSFGDDEYPVINNANGN